MEFKLRGEVRVSGSLENLKEAVTSWIGELNRDVLMRGAKTPEEGARISDWKIEENRLLLTIESGRTVRAHSALLRVRNFLADKLGQYKLGVRGLKAEEIRVTFDGLAASTDAIEKLLENLAEVERIEGKIVIVFRDVSSRDLEKGVIDRVLKKIEPLAKKELITVEKTLTTVSVVREQKLVPMGYVIKASSMKDVKFNGDVSDWAEKLNWIKRYPGRGQWILTAPMTALINLISDMIINDVLKPMGFVEWMLPKLTPLQVMAKMPGYFDNLAEGMLYVFTPEREEEALKEFKRKFSLTGELDLESLKRELSGPNYVLEPAQCTPFYQFFSGEIVNLDDLPVKIFDRSGWTWRWEGKATRGLERTTEFYRIEAIWLASPEDAVRIRDEVAEKSMELADKKLDLEVRMVVGAPFYMSSDEASKTYVDISSSDKIPTIDLEAWLPYRGSREDSEWLEIGGAFSCHRDKYVKSFKIKEAKNRDVWTGCSGFGITRWATAFLAQKGFNPNDWPSEVKRRLGELPKPVKTIT
ncbi:MAG: aminoacyl--tRNA ligase-related protein [Candidatus Bathyarchaeia archaeon]